MKLHSKVGQSESLDVIFQMHIIAKVFVTIKYWKNEKNQKLKKIIKKNKIAQKYPKWQKGQIFF